MARLALSGNSKAVAERRGRGSLARGSCQAVGVSRVCLWRQCHRATWMPENLGTVDPLGLILQSRAVDVVDRWGSVTAGR
jgi:hypothetical protein